MNKKELIENVKEHSKTVDLGQKCAAILCDLLRYIDDEEITDICIKSLIKIEGE